MLAVGTYTIEVTCDGHMVSDEAFSAVISIYPVVISTVSSFYVGKRADFESKSLVVLISAGLGEQEMFLCIYLSEQNIHTSLVHIVHVTYCFGHQCIFVH